MVKRECPKCGWIWERDIFGNPPAHFNGEAVLTSCLQCKAILRLEVIWFDQKGIIMDEKEIAKITIDTFKEYKPLNLGVNELVADIAVARIKEIKAENKLRQIIQKLEAMPRYWPADDGSGRMEVSANGDWVSFRDVGEACNFDTYEAEAINSSVVNQP